MTSSDLKLRIFRQIDALDKTKLEELYGLLMNFINGQVDEGDWESLSVNQKEGIFDALDEIDSGKGIPNKTVLDNIRHRYPHE
jgi:hypothetical protein